MTACVHEKDSILEDFSNGTLVCMKCGIVLENTIFGRPSQEVDLIKVERTCCKYLGVFKNLAHVLNIKEDAIELAVNLFKEYTIENREKHVLTIVFLYYASKILMYTIDMKNFKTVYDNENFTSFGCDKIFNSYLDTIDKFFKQKFKNFDQLYDKFKIPSQFDYYFDLFYPFFILNKTKYNLTIKIYTHIIKDLICKRSDVILVSKSQYSVFLICFFNKLGNLTKKNKQEMCNYFKINLNSLTPIQKVYNALGQKF